jgi:hypothetical protein
LDDSSKAECEAGPVSGRRRHWKAYRNKFHGEGEREKLPIFLGGKETTLPSKFLMHSPFAILEIAGMKQNEYAMMIGHRI